MPAASRTSSNPAQPEWDRGAKAVSDRWAAAHLEPSPPAAAPAPVLIAASAFPAGDTGRRGLGLSKHPTPQPTSWAQDTPRSRSAPRAMFGSPSTMKPSSVERAPNGGCVLSTRTFEVGLVYTFRVSDALPAGAVDPVSQQLIRRKGDRNQ